MATKCDLKRIIGVFVDFAFIFSSHHLYRKLLNNSISISLQSLETTSFKVLLYKYDKNSSYHYNATNICN